MVSGTDVAELVPEALKSSVVRIVLRPSEATCSTPKRGASTQCIDLCQSKGSGRLIHTPVSCLVCIQISFSTGSWSSTLAQRFLNADRSLPSSRSVHTDVDASLDSRCAQSPVFGRSPVTGKPRCSATPIASGYPIRCSSSSRPAVLAPCGPVLCRTERTDAAQDCLCISDLT